jgi:hypothetical protein
LVYHNHRPQTKGTSEDYDAVMKPLLDKTLPRYPPKTQWDLRETSATRLRVCSSCRDPVVVACSVIHLRNWRRSQTRFSVFGVFEGAQPGDVGDTIHRCFLVSLRQGGLD